MRRLALLAALPLVLAVPAAPGRSETPLLVATVGPGFTIVELTPGRYAYACTPHWEVMNGNFVVVPAATPPASPTATHTLSAGVAAGVRSR